MVRRAEARIPDRADPGQNERAHRLIQLYERPPPFSGTTSGPTDDSRACLAEIAARGSQPFGLPNGESRTYLQDGDEAIFRGRAERHGGVGIGFGECRGTVLPAVTWPSA